MKKYLVWYLFFATTALAQTPAPACGPESTKFSVKLDNTQHQIPQPENGKAILVFIDDPGRYFAIVSPTIKIGMDGGWVGANHNASFFTVSAEPGEHHLCASLPLFKSSLKQFVHLNAEAGKIYYFRTLAMYTQYSWWLFLEPVDSDEAQHLLAHSSLSRATEKK